VADVRGCEQVAQAEEYGTPTTYGPGIMDGIAVRLCAELGLIDLHHPSAAGHRLENATNALSNASGHSRTPRELLAYARHKVMRPALRPYDASFFFFSNTPKHHNILHGIPTTKIPSCTSTLT
jgi:hypothetical protein